jgi:Ca2+-binding RTX toxin-like protein
MAFTLPAGDTGFEAITISGRTTQAAGITTDDATIASGTTLVVTTSQTTGALTFDATAEADGSVNITGGAGDDSLTGGGLADTLSGGAGADVLVGLAGNDTIITGAGNNIVTGGVGNDTINLTEGGTDLINFLTNQVGVGTMAGTTAYTDTITGFEVSRDAFAISIATLTSTAATTLSNFAGADIAAAVALGGMTATTLATNASADPSGGTTTILKLSSTTSTSFASSFGSGSVTTAAFGGTGVEVALTIWYDANNTRAVVGLVTPDAAGANAITSTDAFTPIAYIGMTTADYANFGVGNFMYVA